MKYGTLAWVLIFGVGGVWAQGTVPLPNSEADFSWFERMAGQLSVPVVLMIVAYFLSTLYREKDKKLQEVMERQTKDWSEIVKLNTVALTENTDALNRVNAKIGSTSHGDRRG